MYPNRAIHQSVDFIPETPIFIMEIREGEYEEFIYCHWHKLTEIILVEEGYMTLEIDQRVYEMGPGDIAFVNPEEIHYGRDLKGSACRVLVFVFDWSELQISREGSFYKDCIEPLNTLGYSLDALVDAKKATEKNLRFRKILMEINEEYNNRGIYFRDSILALMMLLLVELYKGNLVKRQAVSQPQLQVISVVKEAIRYMEQNYQEKIYISDIANRIALSEDYFYKVFKKATGQTPASYLQYLRISHAKQLLRTSDWSVSRIGEEVGYDSTSYFIKQFQQLVFMTPKQFQKKRYKGE